MRRTVGELAARLGVEPLSPERMKTIQVAISDVENAKPSDPWYGFFDLMNAALDKLEAGGQAEIAPWPTFTASNAGSVAQTADGKPSAVWVHYKGGRYVILEDSARLEWENLGGALYVVYQSLEDGRVWVRNRAVFFGAVTGGGPRFALER